MKLRLVSLLCNVVAFAGLGTISATTDVLAQARVKTYPRAAKPQQQWRLSSRPVLTIGGADSGPEELAMVAATFRSANGDIAVGVMRAAEIRMFDAKGQHLRTLGRQGRGPGEFPVLWSAHRVRDSIFGIDQAGLGQVFAPDGKYVRSLPRASAFGKRVELAGFFADGSMLGYFYPGPLDDAPRGTSTVEVMLVRANASSVDSLFRVAAGSVNRRGSGKPTAIAYGARLQLATFNDRFCESSSSDYRVRCFTSSGTPLIDIRRPDARMPSITQDDRERFFAGIDRANPDPRAASYRREVRELTEFADVRPQIGRLVAATTGELWVGSYDPAEAVAGTLHPSPEGVTTWQVYSASGEWLSEMRLPRGFRLFDAGRDWVLGVRRDEDDVEHVEMYDVSRP